MCALVARAFPGEPSLAGKWSYDSRPRFVVLAEEGGALVGLRSVVDRDVVVDGRTLRMAGLGIAVHPEHQRRGLGTLLTARTLDECVARGFEVAVAFLFTANSERLLRSFGFAPLRAIVRHCDRRSGAVVVERSPAWARALRGDALEVIERAGALDLGHGTW